MSARVAVLGASGFVGSVVVEALARRGALVTAVTAPRLRTSARTAADVSVETFPSVVDQLICEIGRVDVVVVAAGLSDAVSGEPDDLYGANALLPALVARAVDSLDETTSRTTRLVHVSSAAVQGRTQRLDETTSVAPFSPYSHSKALGEQLLARRADTVVFRPTSVHGPGRELTRRLASFLASPFASVAGKGDAPTPQVLVGNVADAIAFVALANQAPPPVVLQPGESMTTGSLVRIIGGREPRHVPTFAARGVVSVLMLVGRRSGRVAGIGRRIEMLWFGQDQVDGWLKAVGWLPVLGSEEWRRLV